MAAIDWPAWLRDFNRELLDRLDLDEASAFRDPRVTRELVATGWLGSPGADESRIAVAEARLRVELPPSYRLAGCLQVSDVELVGTAVYLLDPASRGPDGEWEAYVLAHWIPGVDRYPSFLHLMQAQRRMHVDRPSQDELGPRPAPSAWRVLWDALRNRPS